MPAGYPASGGATDAQASATATANAAAGTPAGGTGTTTSGGITINGQTYASTGNPQLDALFNSLGGYLTSTLAAGQQINPNIQITPAMVTQFTQQAQTNIDPYYASQLTAIQGDLQSTLTNIAQTQAATNQQEGLNLQQNLAASRESSAGAGTAFSGGRNLGEQQEVQSEQSTLDLDALRAQSSAQSAVSSAAQQIGSSNLPSLATLYGGTASGAGLGGVTTGSALNIMPGYTTTTGSLQYAQNTDIQNAVLAQENAAVAQQSNKPTLASLTTPATTS